jgi:hypothetical protein
MTVLLLHRSLLAKHPMSQFWVSIRWKFECQSMEAVVVASKTGKTSAYVVEPRLVLHRHLLASAGKK